MFDRSISKQIQGMAGLRNILVHEYLRVDTGKLHDYLQHRLTDFTEFIAHIQLYLGRKS